MTMIPTTPIGEALSINPFNGRPVLLPTDPPGTVGPQPFANDPWPANLPLALTTTNQYQDDVKIERSVDGTGRARVFYTAPKTHINARLASLTQTEFNQFESFYLTHRAQGFLLPWPPCSGATLGVMFLTAPSYTHDGNHLHTVTFELVEFP